LEKRRKGGTIVLIVEYVAPGNCDVEKAKVILFRVGVISEAEALLITRRF